MPPPRKTAAQVPTTPIKAGREVSPFLQKAYPQKHFSCQPCFGPPFETLTCPIMLQRTTDIEAGVRQPPPLTGMRTPKTMAVLSEPILWGGQQPAAIARIHS